MLIFDILSLVAFLVLCAGVISQIRKIWPMSDVSAISLIDVSARFLSTLVLSLKFVYVSNDIWLTMGSFLMASAILFLGVTVVVKKHKMKQTKKEIPSG